MKPWLRLSPLLAHDLAPYALRFLAGFRGAETYSWAPREWRSLKFANPLGIAGGVDKNGALIEEWWTFGPGFIEIGTVTPQAQEANPGPILDRDLSERALWNRMGFPNDGALAVLTNLRDLPRPRHTPVFVNIGKNRTTPNENAAQDYAECMNVFGDYADAYVVNISSPNTSGLRELLQPQHLKKFLGAVLSSRNKSATAKTPVLLKLSPDLDAADLTSVIEISAGLGIDGFIATNTTLAREHGSRFPVEGGISGGPLASRSKEVLGQIKKILGASHKDTLVVSVGGILTPEDVFERLELGADLVQVYTALTLAGPFFFQDVANAAHGSARHAFQD